MGSKEEEGEEEEEKVSFGVGECAIKHPSEYTLIEVCFFLIAIGLESKCEVFEEKRIDGKMLISLTKTELEAELGFSSIEIQKFIIALEFSIHIAEGPSC